jgi:hypothetical protein
VACGRQLQREQTLLRENFTASGCFGLSSVFESLEQPVFDAFGCLFSDAPSACTRMNHRHPTDTVSAQETKPPASEANPFPRFPADPEPFSDGRSGREASRGIGHVQQSAAFTDPIHSIGKAADNRVPQNVGANGEILPGQRVMRFRREFAAVSVVQFALCRRPMKSLTVEVKSRSRQSVNRDWSTTKGEAASDYEANDENELK